MTALSALEKRLSTLEMKLTPFVMVGTMEDGSTKFFDRKKIFNSHFEVWCLEHENRDPTMDDFNEGDQIFMKDFIRARFPFERYTTALRQSFWIVEKGDFGIYEMPLEKFIEPVV